MLNRDQKLEALSYFLGWPQTSGSNSSENYDLAQRLAAGGELKATADRRMVPVLKDLHATIEKNLSFEPTALQLKLSMRKDLSIQNADAALDKARKAVAKKVDYADKMRALKFHGSLVGCGIEGLETVSLYQHVRSCMAFLEALSASTNENEPFLLVGADISGLQEYLYDIISTNASKNLKGRSFYLQLLADNIVERLKKDCGLGDEMILYNSGGGFYALAPNNNTIKEALDRLQRQLEQRMFEEHQGQLYVVLDRVAFAKKDVTAGMHGEVWQRLGERISKRKKQRFSTLLLHQFDAFFEPIPVNSSETDAITGQIIDPDERKTAKTLSKNGALILRSTWEQIDLGKHLKKAKALRIVEEAIGSAALFEFGKPGIGLNTYLYSSLVPDSKVLNQYHEDYDTYLYGGNAYPEDEDGGPKPFENLIDSGFNKLGVLRMDVDNLGKTFIQGLKKQRLSFSKYAELSLSLDRFFRGYLNQIHAKDEYKNSTYILYSGGDDLFIVGDWKKTLAFAKQINDEFKVWACGNPNLSLSAGLVFTSPKFPIIRSAELAGQAEELAKNFERQGGKRKNALNILETTIGWEELEAVEGWREKWIAWLGNNDVSKGTLYKFFTYYEMKNTPDVTSEKVGKNVRVANKFRWQWMATYALARQKKNTATAELEKIILQGRDNYRALDLCCLGGKLAELEIR